MAPKLTPAQIGAVVAKLKADRVGGKIECELPDDPDSSYGRAWAYFLKRMVELAPGAIDCLFALHRLGDPLPNERLLKCWARLCGLVGEVLVEGEVRIEPLPLVLAWARNALTEHDARTPPGAWLPKRFTPPPPRLEAWHPGQQTRQRYRKYVNDFIDHYMDGVKAQAIAAGAQPPRFEKKREQVHFDWLIRFQIWTEPVPSIAKSVNVYLTARQKQARVRAAINDMAASLGLKVRPA